MELVLSRFCCVYVHDNLFFFHCINIIISYVTKTQLCRAADNIIFVNLRFQNEVFISFLIEFSLLSGGGPL